MTIIEPSLVCVAGAVTVVAVMDPSVTNIALAVIGAAVALTPVYFKYRTDLLKSKVEAAEKKIAASDQKLIQHDVEIKDVTKTSDGMKTELVEATRQASLALGVLEGIKQAEAAATVKTLAVAQGVAQEKAAEQERKTTAP